MTLSPARMGKSEIVVAVSAGRGLLALLTAEAPAPGGTGEAPVRVFWLAMDGRLPSREAIPPDPAGPGIAATIGEALRGLLDPWQWWLLHPVAVHPRWRAALREEIQRRFPGWTEDPRRHAAGWHTCLEWHARLAEGEG